MANQNGTIFSGILDYLRRGRTGNDADSKERLITNQPSTPYKGIEDKQQEFLDVQSNKIAYDLYTRSIYYDTDRMTAYNDFKAMDSSPEISAALDILTDEICTKSEKGEILQIYSNNSRIKNVLKDLFLNTLNIEYNLMFWAREMMKYGDFFLKLEIDKEIGIFDCRAMPVAELHREEAYDGNLNSARFRWDLNNMYFEEWQVAHFRIATDGARLPYGRCLKWDTYVETENGVKFIKDITPGEDKVWSFDTKTQKRVLSNVLDKVCSGKKEIYKIRTRNNELESSIEHQIMFYDKSINNFSYKQVSELNVGDLLIINKQVETNNKIKINKEICEDINKNGYRKNLNLIPEYVNEEFAMLFGFMLGDGWVNNNNVCFALGVENDINEKYINLLEKFSGHKVNFIKNANKEGQLCFSQVSCGSKMLKKILQKNGFVGNVYSKRFPEWVFNAEKNIQEAFMKGLYEADGSINIDEWDCKRYSLELTNEYLVKDAKILLQRLGRKTGKICSKIREKVFFWNKEHNKKESFYFYYYESEIKQKEKYETKLRLTDGFIVEPIISIENTEKIEDVYDIYIENENHNFYANGIVVHNSILESARKLWKQLQLAEDSMLVYRLLRAPERRVYYIEVGNTDPADIPQYIEKMKAAMKKSSVVDPKTGQVNLKYNAMPVWKNTPIPLLDGRTITIEELSKEFDNGKENFVFSVQDDTHQIVPGKVIWCGKNYTATKLTKVWLDDETWILTAPEHPFVLRDGSAKRADELCEGDALMPFYAKKDKLFKKHDTVKEYSQIYNPNTGNYEFVHRLVAKEIEKENKKHNTIHHKDFNRYNNRPDNLQWVDFNEHKKMHKDIIIKWNKSDKKKKRVSKSNKERDSVEKISWYNFSELHKKHNKIRSKAMSDFWNNVNKKEETKKAMKIQFNDKCFQIACDEIKKHKKFINADNFILSLKDTEFYSEIIKANENSNRDLTKIFHRSKLREFLKLNNIKSYNEFLKIYNPTLLDSKKEDYRKQRITWNENNLEKNKLGQYEYKNHKVLRVELIDSDGEDVYCMTVVGLDGSHDRHNFACLSFTNDFTPKEGSGVFVKNTYEEDYFIPIRGDKSSKIETLQGACIALDTKIPLLDGRVLELNEIISEWNNGNKDMWVYSCDPKTGKIAPGIITWAGETRKNTDVLKITLDNGKTITTTPDHKFVHRTNGFVEAQNLKIGDSLMPFYSDTKKMKSNTSDYHRVFDNEKQEWVFTHRMVTDCLNNFGLIKEFVFDEKYLNGTKKIRHHKSLNRFDNSPQNIVWMNGADHMKYHQKVIMETIWSNPELNKKKISKGLKKYLSELSETELKNRFANMNTSERKIKSTEKLLNWNNNEENLNKRLVNSKKRKNTIESKEKVSINSKKLWLDENYSKSVFSKPQKLVYSDDLYSMFFNEFSKQGRADLTLEVLNTNNDFINEFYICNNDVRSSLVNIKIFTHNNLENMLKDRGFKNYREWAKCTALELGYKNVRAWRYYIKKDKQENEVFYNHKIISIEWLDEKMDTGTITVDGHELYHNYHTFATENQVFISNSNLNDIADVEYLQNKLFAAIKVPRTYLNYADKLEGGSTLAQADLRFARTVNRMQEAILVELRRIANIHLYFLGFEDDMDNFNLKLTNPSTQQELLKLEVMKLRLEVFKEMFSAEATSPTSYTWAMQNILGFSESEIKLILKQKKVEKKMFAEIEEAAENYKKIGLFKDIDKKFTKGAGDEKDAGIAPGNEETGEESTGGGGGGGGMTMPSGGGGESPFGGGEEPGAEGGNEEPGAEGGGEEGGEELSENILITENSKMFAKTRNLLKNLDKQFKISPENLKEK